MRLNRLTITNFKGITHVDLENLRDTVVIAGPNGCGKSCIFDAIRLWKSAYGGYIQNEIHNWFNENGLNFGTNSILKTLQNPNEPMSIYAELQIGEGEQAWLRDNITAILRAAAFRKRVPDQGWEWKSFNEVALDDRFKHHENDVNQEVDYLRPLFLSELDNGIHEGLLTCSSLGQLSTIQSHVLPIIFNIYDPENIGKFEYHGAQRNYVRENLGGINLGVDQFANQRINYSLYNTNSKYSSVKTELAESYIKNLIANASPQTGGMVRRQSLDLIETLKEMFDRFFPGKEFLGVIPNPDGTLSFNVRTAIGDHDINELSAGEKELIYGYLRLKNESPNNSIIMLDEPELHLNPRLTMGLPDFYHTHIGRALDNQLWLVTHSDSILRQSVGKDGFSVYHMQPAGLLEGDQQAVEISASEMLERAIIDLVGDLAAYKPNGKIVFLEGGGDSRFDEEFILDLFPEFLGRVNLLSAGNKRQVRNIQDILNAASSANIISEKIYSINDRDDDGSSQIASSGRSFSWDRYHIENYLLEEIFILEALNELKVNNYRSLTIESVSEMLIVCARETLDTLVRHEAENYIRRAFLAAVKIISNKNEIFDVDAANAIIHSNIDKVNKLSVEDLRSEKIEQIIGLCLSRREESLIDGTWKSEFRGRDILKRLSSKFDRLRYETLRNIIIGRMKAASFRPEGMRTIIDAIVGDCS